MSLMRFMNKTGKYRNVFIYLATLLSAEIMINFHNCIRWPNQLV